MAIRYVTKKDNFLVPDDNDNPVGEAEKVFRSYFNDDHTGSVQWGVVKKEFGCVPAANDTDWAVGMNKIIDILNALILLPQKPSEKYVRSQFGI